VGRELATGRHAGDAAQGIERPRVQREQDRAALLVRQFREPLQRVVIETAGRHFVARPARHGLVTRDACELAPRVVTEVDPLLGHRTTAGLALLIDARRAIQTVEGARVLQVGRARRIQRRKSSPKLQFEIEGIETLRLLPALGTV
jgi:hypothetical protein